MEEAKKGMMKVLKSYAEGAVVEAVLKLSAKYKFVAAEAEAYLGVVREPSSASGSQEQETASSKASSKTSTGGIKKVKGERGRPEKAVKAVLNKDVLVEDVIARLYTAEALGESSEAVEADAGAAPAVVAVKKKKNPAPNKKPEEPAVVVVAPVVEVAPVVAPVVVAPVEATNKKITKKKADAPVVVEPVVVTPVVVEVAAVVAPVVVETPVEAGKKKITKKKADAVADAVVEVAPAPVVVAPVVVAPVAADKSVGGYKFKAAAAEVVEAEPEAFVAEEEEAASEDEDEEEAEPVECDDFTHEGVEYTRDENGIVYDLETSEPIGKWTGTSIELFPVDAEEEDEE